MDWWPNGSEIGITVIHKLLCLIMSQEIFIKRKPPLNKVLVNIHITEGLVEKTEVTILKKSTTEVWLTLQFVPVSLYLACSLSSSPFSLLFQGQNDRLSWRTDLGPSCYLGSWGFTFNTCQCIFVQRVLFKRNYGTSCSCNNFST